MTSKIGPALQQALLRLDRLGEASEWMLFAMVGKRGRTNVMRHLKKRRLVEDVNENARDTYAKERQRGWPIPYRKHPPRWMLTEAGRDIVESLKQQRKKQTTP